MHSRRTKAKIYSAFDRPPRSEVAQVVLPKLPRPLRGEWITASVVPPGDGGPGLPQPMPLSRQFARRIHHSAADLA